MKDYKEDVVDIRGKKLERAWEMEKYGRVKELLEDYNGLSPSEIRSRAVSYIDKGDYIGLIWMKKELGEIYLFDEEIKGEVYRMIDEGEGKNARTLLDLYDIDRESFQGVVERKAEHYFEQEDFKNLGRLMEFGSGKTGIDEEKIQEKYDDLIAGGRLNEVFNMSLVVESGPEKQLVDKHFRRYAKNNDVEKIDLLQYVTEYPVPEDVNKILLEDTNDNVEYLYDYLKTEGVKRNPNK